LRGAHSAALKLLRDSRIVDEAVILSTCNRVEIYAATPLAPREAFQSLKEFLVTATIIAIQLPMKSIV